MLLLITFQIYIYIFFFFVCWKSNNTMKKEDVGDRRWEPRKTTKNKSRKGERKPPQSYLSDHSAAKAFCPQPSAAQALSPQFPDFRYIILVPRSQITEPRSDIRAQIPASRSRILDHFSELRSRSFDLRSDQTSEHSGALRNPEIPRIWHLALAKWHLAPKLPNLSQNGNGMKQFFIKCLESRNLLQKQTWIHQNALKLATNTKETIGFQINQT